MYCQTDELWTKNKSILNCHRDGFTDCQWSQHSHLLSENRLNDGQFSIFTNMLDTHPNKNWFSCMQVEEQEKPLSHVIFFEEWALRCEICCACVQQVLVLHIYHNVVLFIVFEDIVAKFKRKYCNRWHAQVHQKCKARWYLWGIKYCPAMSR